MPTGTVTHDGEREVVFLTGIIIATSLAAAPLTRYYAPRGIMVG